MVNKIKQTNIYLHGLFGNENEFDELIKQFGEANFHHLPISLPTPKPDSSFEHYIHLLHKLICNIKTIGKLNLVGFSMGGRISFYLKYYYPKKYNRVILISAQAISHENNETRNKTDQSRLDNIQDQKEFTNWLHSFFAMEIYGNFNKTLHYEKKIKTIKFDQIDRYRSFFSALSVSNQPNIAHIPWQKNLCFITGEEDKKYSSLSKKYAELYPLASFISIPKCAHALHLEKPIILANKILQII